MLEEEGLTELRMPTKLWLTTHSPASGTLYLHTVPGGLL